jgi:cell wall-associated NlpC family hydrolase
MKHRFARPTISAVCVALVGLVGMPSASASKIDDKKALAAQLQREIDANGEQISMLAERYDGARLRLDDARQNIARVEGRLAAARAESHRIGAVAQRRAAALYMGVGAQSPLGFTNVASLTEAGSRSTYAAAAADRDARLLDGLRASREDLRVAETSLEAARNKAQKEVDALVARRRDVEAANARQTQLLAQVKGEVATLIREEQARQAAAEKARSDARLEQLRLQAAQSRANASSGTGVQTFGPAGTDPAQMPIPTAPAPSPGAAAAVAYAKSQLGKPYRYAAAGPDEFDCSGLTMMAWAQAGVSMPHYSAAQGAMFPRVPDGQLQPGDLVIYYSDQHHVGIYVGDGMTISATHTGDFVRLQPVFRSGFQYAVRP